MRRVVLLLALLLLLASPAAALDGYDYYQTIDYSATDVPSYQQDLVIHRTTGTAYEEESDGLKTWHLYVGDHCREDYGDVRFTNSTGAELAYYLWPDYDNESARICVRLERATSAGTLTAWYGNPSVETTSDGDGVYILFDHFDGDVLDTDIWGVHAETRGTVSVSSSEVTLTSTASGAPNHGIHSLASVMVPGRMLEVRSKSLGGSYVTYVGAADDPYYRRPHGDSTTDGFSMYGPDEGGSYVSYADSSSRDYKVTSNPSAGYHQYRIGWESASSVRFLRDGAELCRLASTSYIPDKSLPVYFSTEDSSNPELVVDYALVRAYSAAPPSATAFSSEQQTAAPPTAQFSAAPTLGARPLTVQFTDTSTCSPTSWSWTFGDGTTSTEQNPTHTYQDVGTYTVTLTATNEYGTDSETKTDYIDVGDPPVASFTASPSHGYAPLTVQFTDTSTNAPTSWSWTFGDGNTSTEQNPTHTYQDVGTYTVTLTVSNAYGEDTETTTVTASTIYPFPGLSLVPQDLDADSRYEDVNGNGRLDFNDLTVFFKNIAWAKENEPIEAFDLNGNDRIDYKDVTLLFIEITEVST